MSDFPQSPAWWQASDGKWYPPETHPNAMPAPRLASPSLPTAQSPMTAQVFNQAAPKPKRPIWRRWWAIGLGGFVLLIVMIAIFAPPPEEDADAEAATAATQISESSGPAEATLPAATLPAVTVPPDTSPTEQTPTTEFVLSVDDIRTLAFPITFDSSRNEVLALLSDLTIVQSVDRYEYDADSGTVVVNLTPAFDFDEGVRDDAWGIMRAMSNLWIEGWYEPDTGWSPALDVSISTAQYSCTGEQMRAMSDARFSRADWEANCRIR
ncbi:MAG: hypothetical protein WBL31_06305 [Ilumatobacteraceae bacterium]